MHAWIIPVSLGAMMIIGWALTPNNLDRLWWRLEGWINGDPPMAYKEVFGAREDTDFLWEQAERWPMCPGAGCPNQLPDVRQEWEEGTYCWRYLP